MDIIVGLPQGGEVTVEVPLECTVAGLHNAVHRALGGTSTPWQDTDEIDTFQQLCLGGEPLEVDTLLRNLAFETGFILIEGKRVTAVRELGEMGVGTRRMDKRLLAELGTGARTGKARETRIHTIQLLLDAGASPTTESFCMAASRANHRALELLYAAGAIPSEDALYRLSVCGNPFDESCLDSMRFLVEVCGLPLTLEIYKNCAAAGQEACCVYILQSNGVSPDMVTMVGPLDASLVQICSGNSKRSKKMAASAPFASDVHRLLEAGHKGHSRRQHAGRVA